MANSFCKQHLGQACQHHGRTRTRSGTLCDRIADGTLNPCSSTAVPHADLKQSRKTEKDRFSKAFVAAQKSTDDSRRCARSPVIEFRDLSSPQLVQAFAG